MKTVNLLHSGPIAVELLQREHFFYQFCRNLKNEGLLRGGLSVERRFTYTTIIHNYPVEKNVDVSGLPNQMRPSSVVVVYVPSPGSKPCIGRALAI